MTKKQVIALTVAIFLLIATTSAVASTSAGTSADPLISRQYAEGTFAAGVINQARGLIEDALAELGGGGSTGSFEQAQLQNGNTVTLGFGGSVVLISGSASLSVTSGTVINVTRGEEAKSGPLNRYERYMAVENTVAVVTATSDSQVSCDGNAVIGSGPSGSPIFTDVTDSNWARSYIEKLANAGYVNGTGNGMFSPSNNMTRADFVTILGRIAGVNPSDYTTSSFTDVAAGAYYAPYVEWAVQSGIVTGIGNNAFAPTSNITRSQMALIASNYAKYAGISLSDSGDGSTFTDDASIESWAYDAVYAMRNAGIINGKPNNLFDPKGTATRAEVCAVICRLIYGDQ